VWIDQSDVDAADTIRANIPILEIDVEQKNDVLRTYRYSTNLMVGG